MWFRKIRMWAIISILAMWCSQVCAQDIIGYSPAPPNMLAVESLEVYSKPPVYQQIMNAIRWLKRSNSRPLYQQTIDSICSLIEQIDLRSKDKPHCYDTKYKEISNIEFSAVSAVKDAMETVANLAKERRKLINNRKGNQEETLDEMINNYADEKFFDLIFCSLCELLVEVCNKEQAPDIRTFLEPISKNDGKLYPLEFKLAAEHHINKLDKKFSTENQEKKAQNDSLVQVLKIIQERHLEKFFSDTKIGIVKRSGKEQLITMNEVVENDGKEGEGVRKKQSDGSIILERKGKEYTYIAYVNFRYIKYVLPVAEFLNEPAENLCIIIKTYDEEQEKEVVRGEIVVSRMDDNTVKYEMYDYATGKFTPLNPEERIDMSEIGKATLYMNMGAVRSMNKDGARILFEGFKIPK